MNLRVITAVAGTAFLLAGCASDEAPTPAPTLTASSTPVAPELLASRASSGGRCQDGPCHSMFAVYTDGSWTLSTNTISSNGVLDESALAILRDGITTTGIPTAPAFTGTCPSAYDGQEVVYTWRGTDGLPATVSACDVSISETDPLVQALLSVEANATTTSSSPAQAGGPTPPSVDDMETQAAKTQAVASALIGLGEDAAVAKVRAAEMNHRVVSRDGKDFPVTMDYRPDRINLTIVGGIITETSVG